MSKLVIVESPAKAATIKKYLGSDYKVKASMGHLRDLPKKKLGVKLRTIEPEYVPIENKSDIIEELRESAEKSDMVYLATDPDREGEAISWHLSQLLRIDETEKNRVTFNEITKNAVTEGIKNPRAIDMDLVDAQQARRVLDRLVGYKISPLLWKTIRSRLSAGRVQSVVTRLIVDREREIRAFVPEEYWSLDVNLLKKGIKRAFKAKYYGDETGKVDLKTEEQTYRVKAEVENEVFVVGTIKKGKKQLKPAPPFTTSTMQQESSKRLNMSSRSTMRVAQELYEGINLEGRGQIGLITYMRTDSLRLSDDAVASIREYIKRTFKSDHCTKEPRVYKSKGKAQDAHEAIRPTDIMITPDEIKSSLSRDQYRLYKLIWERTVASQMTNAIYDTVSVDIKAGRHIFKSTGSTVKFPGFTALYTYEDEEDEKNVKVPELIEGETLTLESINPDQHFTQPPARYNEASLIKTMEELGIGRPSTYAPTISTVIQRDYVEKEGKALKPTQLAEIVTDLMISKFPDIVDARFTAGMEERLDEIASGEKEWKEVIKTFYKGLSAELKQAEAELKDTKIKLEPEYSGDICPVCGKPMVYKNGRYGKFIACSGYPECKSIKKTEAEYEPTGENCELCGKPMVHRTGRYGKFIACSGYPECKNIKNKTEIADGACPMCGKRMTKRFSKRGRLYYSCEDWENCKFMTWDTPINEKCPKCSRLLFRSGKNKIVCLSESCGYVNENGASSDKKEEE
ncbi:MAG: type I DNA topoisomerase [Clostridiales bacterium]|nr:type I DNA topoisomerase [Clostridiales bacterium]